MSIFHYDQGIQIFHKGIATKPQSETEDPTYLGFNLIFDFYPTHRDASDQLTHDALFVDAEDGNKYGLDSAEQYLVDLGYIAKANMLVGFKNTLKYVNTVTPYYLQSIEGIADLWKIDTNPESFNNFRGKDKVLTINCLESFDMRITSMADMYRKATFDAQSMRELLPENLRHFTLRLQVIEIRKFHKIKEFVQNNTQTDLLNANTKASPDFVPKQTEFQMLDMEKNISVLEFKLSFCEFDFSESFPVEVVSNADSEMAKQKFKIKVGRITETNTYVNLKDFLNNAILNDAYTAITDINDDSSVNLRSMPNDLTEIQDIKSRSNAYADNASKYGQISTTIRGALSDLQSKIERAPSDLVARGINNVQSKVTNAVLGNVYNKPLSAVLNPFIDEKNQLLPQSIGGNVYPPTPPSITKIGEEDVYPGVPEPPKDYPSSLGNVY